VRIQPCGDSALAVELGDLIDETINARVMTLDRAINRMGYPVLETVPTYRSLVVHYDALAIDYSELAAQVAVLAENLPDERHVGRRWEIPVVYGGRFGVDLASVAQLHSLSPGEVIRRHSAPVYRVFMIGFMPGFAYLGGLDPTLATPRLETPRKATPAGSISIGGAQAAAASIAAPSGWHLLGRTPVRLFMPDRNPVCILAPGDSVVFKPIDEDAWPSLALAAHQGAVVAREFETACASDVALSPTAKQQ
jgi:KipI family sensor histidine kinase inhibitor